MRSLCPWAYVCLGEQRKTDSEAASPFPGFSTPPSFQPVSDQSWWCDSCVRYLVLALFLMYLLLVTAEAKTLPLELHGCFSLHAAGSETELRFFFSHGNSSDHLTRCLLSMTARQLYPCAGWALSSHQNKTDWSFHQSHINFTESL